MPDISDLLFAGKILFNGFLTKASERLFEWADEHLSRRYPPRE